MRVAIFACALALSIACVSSSAVESTAVLKDLTEKGHKAAREADELMRQDRLQAALEVMDLHVSEVEATIARVENDPALAASHKTELLARLRKYHSDLEDNNQRIRQMRDLMSEYGGR